MRVICSCIVASAITAVAAIGPAAAQNERYGAMYYSVKTKTLGLALDEPSRDAAERRALQDCRQSAGDCKPGVWFRNACGSVAVGKRGGWGTGWGDSEVRAERFALESCSNYDMSCKIQTTKCTTDPGQDADGGTPGE